MATICAGARATYDALEAAVRPSQHVLLHPSGILADSPPVQCDALRRYAAMDKTWPNFNKDWGYMACVKSARGHARAPAPQQPRPAAPRRPVTRTPAPQQPRPAAPRRPVTRTPAPPQPRPAAPRRPVTKAPTTPQPRPAAPRRPVTKAPTTPQPRPAPRRAVITPPPVPSLSPAAAAADSDESWLANVKGAADAKQAAALEALRDRPLVARDESFGLIVRAVRETTTVPGLVARATQLVDGLEGARRQTVADLKKVPATPSRRLARFVLSPSTLGVYIHYRCPRVLLRLAKRNAGLDYRVRATEASRGSTATKAFDSGTAIVPGGPTDRDVFEAAAALSMVSLVSGRGSDHEMWLNGQLETVGVACESWFRSEVTAEVPRKFHLVDVEKKACARPRDGVRFENAYDALSLNYLREAPVGTALFQPALNVKLIGEHIGPRGNISGERCVYAALGLLDAFDRGDVSLSRALVDYVLVVPDALGRRCLVVIDAKASKRVKLEHQFQVTLYTMLIDVAFGHTDFVAAAPGVCIVGGVWLPARAAPQIFEVAGLQKKVRDMLANEVSALLTADAHVRSFEEDTDDWVLRTSCGTCNFRASCEKQAASRGRLCALPGLRPDDAVELKAFAAGTAGRTAIERLETAVRTVVPSTMTKVTRRALARGIHLQYEDDAPPSLLPPTLRAQRENAVVPTGRPSASLPYRHVEEVACVCVCVDDHFRSRAPMTFVVARAPHHGELWQRSLVVSYAPFSGDVHAPAAVGYARMMRVSLVNAVHDALLPFNRRRVCVCCPEAADRSALFDAVLRIAMESETSDAARRARLVMATLGAEPTQLLLAGNSPTLGDEASEAHQFLPRCSVLVEETKRLFAVPSVRATTFEDCCAYLPLDGDLRAAAVDCSREAVFRAWALLGPEQLGRTVHSAVIKSRVATLLERRASLGLALLNGVRARCRSGAATPTTTQDMDAEDIVADRRFPLLPFKAARVRLDDTGAINHPHLSRLRLLAQLETSATISALRAQRIRPLDELVAGDKVAVLRLAQNASGPKLWFDVVRGAAPREPDALMNFACMLVPVSGSPAVALRFPDFAQCDSFQPQTSLPIFFASVVAVGDGRCRLSVKKQKNNMLDAWEEYALVRRHVDFTTRATITELERCAAAPQDSLFARLLGDSARAWCEEPGWKADELTAAHVELERARPSHSTVSQDAGLDRVLACRCCVMKGPPGAGKTHWGADTILRVCRAAERIGVAFKVLVTACTHSALDCLLEKLCSLRRADDKVNVLKCDADAKRPTTPGQSCWVTLTRKDGAVAKRYIAAQKVAGVIVAVAADRETLDVRLGSGDVHRAVPKNCFRHRHAFDVFAGTAEKVDAEIFGIEGCVVVGATTHRAGKVLAAEVVQGRFNVLLIDEASQMLPSVAALAIKALDPERGRLVILGDPKQMRPTIRTQLPEETDVGASILDLAVESLRGSPCLGRLDENHRMCPELCNFTETALGYPGYRICSAGSCTCRRVARPFSSLSFTGADAKILDEALPLVVVELAGNGVPLADLRAAEAAHCASLVRAYDAAATGTSRTRGAFLVTPHHAQRLAVSAALGPLAAHCTVDTVERMQGRERDLVIVCLVGLDLNGDDDGVELDFVYDACRIVVALTRAKKKCVVLATARLFDPSMHVFDTPARREAYRLLLGVRAYADARGSVVARALPAPIFLAPVVPTPAAPPPAPAPPPVDEEELVDLSQALSLDDGHVTSPDGDDETLEDRAPSPTKRNRTESEEFLDADDVVPVEWVAAPKRAKTRKTYCCGKCGQPKKGHACPFE